VNVLINLKGISKYLMFRNGYKLKTCTTGSLVTFMIVLVLKYCIGLDNSVMSCIVFTFQSVIMLNGGRLYLRHTCGRLLFGVALSL
jgi:hypothetical protein